MLWQKNIWYPWTEKDAASFLDSVAKIENELETSTIQEILKATKSS